MFFQKAEKVSVSYQFSPLFYLYINRFEQLFEFVFHKNHHGMDDFLKFTDSGITGYLIKFSMKSKFTDRGIFIVLKSDSQPDNLLQFNNIFRSYILEKITANSQFQSNPET